MGDAALGNALEVWGDLEMRKGIPARKRCQPHSPPATALHDAIAFNGAFRRFMGTMRGKLAVEASCEFRGPTPHPDPLPSHPMGAERGSAFVWLRRDRSAFVALRRELMQGALAITPDMETRPSKKKRSKLWLFSESHAAPGLGQPLSGSIIVIRALQLCRRREAKG
jgi:hypothetical protein